MENKVLVKLAKTNINILGVTESDGDNLVIYEYQWRTAGGKPKWSRGVLRCKPPLDLDDVAGEVYIRVQELRSELES